MADDGTPYFYNVETKESVWDHPLDAHYQQMFEAELKKLGKKHRKKEKAYRHIKTLEAKNKAGEKLEKNQLIKLQSGLKTQLEKELLEFAETRQKLLLAASVDVRERVGVCGKCGSLAY